MRNRKIYQEETLWRKSQSSLSEVYLEVQDKLDNAVANNNVDDIMYYQQVLAQVDNAIDDMLVSI